jgi:hypothetical protein
MLGFLRHNCTYLTDVNCQRSLYLTLVRTHVCYGSEIWAPQTASRVCLESVHRRATKYILQDFTSSYTNRLTLFRNRPGILQVHIFGSVHVI